MCALLISVITLSGAVNRSFRTEMEQWNPIGFTQAQSGPQTTNRLTAGGAILPTVATAAPSGELRGVSRNVITFTTSKKIGESIKLKITYMGFLSLSGATGTHKSGEWSTYTLTEQTVTIRGDVLFLDCAENRLTALDVSKNTALLGLYCSRNLLTALDVSKNTELGALNCTGNQIKGKEMTRLVKSLPNRTGKKAGTFTVVQEPAPEFNICLKSDVAIAKRKNWNTQKYKSNTKKYVPYEGKEPSHKISFTTAKAVGESVKLKMTYTGSLSLRGLTGTPVSGTEVIYKLTSQTVTIQGDVTVLYCNGNKLTTLDVSQNTALTELYCHSNLLTTLDVSQNTALTRFYFDYNQLTTLDVSKNTALTTLSCAYNPLTALDVSKNTALMKLRCFNNQLTALDVSKNTALTELYCSHNPLTALDVSKNTALRNLECLDNQLTALDVSKNTALAALYCYNNQIKGEEMTRLVNSLPDRTGKAAGTFTVVQEPALEGNICLKSDVAIAKSKNWNTQKRDTDFGLYDAYEGADASRNIMSFTTAKAVGETIELQMTYTGDAPTLSGATGTPKSGTEVIYKLTSRTVTIRGDVTFLDCSGNQLTALDVSRNTALEKLYCYNNQLTALDVSNNTALTTLDCSDNQLTALDVSKNTALTGLFCINNQLTTLDVSKNTVLTMLKCYENQLTALDVSQNTALEELWCSKNQLTALDVSKNTELAYLICWTNQLTALDVSQNTALIWLFCSENQLTTLDVSQNTALEKLDCSGNQLTALDVSQNTFLTRLNCFGNQIKGEEMTRLVNSLPDRMGTEAGEFAVVQEPSPEGNRCLKTDVAIAKSKNWNTLKYKSDTEESVPYEGEEPIPYAVTLTKEGEGTLTATGAADLSAVPEGTELTIEATPADGYELKALTANGTDILATKKFTVTANTEVKATFTKKTFAVTLTKEGEGTLTATGADDLNAVPEGTELTIEATPAAGYELTALTANGTDILATKKFVVTAATEVKATFAKKTAADVVESSSVRLYPNPASTYVSVKGAKADALVRLYDANGSLQYEARTDADGTLQIDLSAYAEGTYLLRVGNDAQRLLIQR